MKKLYLSNSQIETYLDCNRKWYIDKVERLRPNFTGSALIFGSAIDSTIEAYVEDKKVDYKKVFLKELANFEVNGKAKKFPKDVLSVKFFASDVDPRLIKETPELIVNYCKKLKIKTVDILEFLEYCKDRRRVKEELLEKEQKLFNYMAYVTLQKKGLLITEALVEWIDENIAEVLGTQKRIEITNENGDKFVGYSDLIAIMKDGRKVLIDLKTSSNPTIYYPEDSAETSRQLGIYSQEEEIEDVAYLVANKKVFVRGDNRIKLSFVEGKITEEHLDDIFDEIEAVTEEIKEKLVLGKGAFDKNKESCSKYGKCQYVDYCWKGKKDKLEKV